MANLVITIDGPAASGKSTVAKLLAEKIGASFLDTGAMYRAVTLAAVQDGVDIADEQALVNIIKRHTFRFEPQQDEMVVYIDGNNVTERIRNPELTANVRFIASSPKMREKLVQMQREFAAGQQKIVTEGRDQGTVAFADANIKFYLTADAAERARRRQAELQAKGINESLEELTRAIEDRDKNDQSRAVGPLKPADDAIVIDTTNLGIEQVVEELLRTIREKCSGKS